MIFRSEKYYVFCCYCFGKISSFKPKIQVKLRPVETDFLYEKMLCERQSANHWTEFQVTALLLIY